jgi:benzylsuccinate CoA-transferase BbsE subunit
MGLGWGDLSARAPGLVMASVTPFGQASARSAEPVTDLTLMAESGPVWSCGYDDHELPPVRGGGNQSFQTACNWAMTSILVALLEREGSGAGQRIDVSMSAASNVSTEVATYGYLVSGMEVFRQTGRHASSVPSGATQVRCKDGRYASSGLLARDPAAFALILRLLDHLGLRDEFPMTFLLEMGSQREQLSYADIATDSMVAEIFTAARDVMAFLAEHLDAYDFFTETQRLGIATGAIYTPGEALLDPNAVARGFPTEVVHQDLGRTFVYPGAPYRFIGTPWATSRAPFLGEHQDLL